MTRRIVIAGSGGFGRGVFGWLMDSPLHRNSHGITDVVYIDDARSDESLRAPLISSIDEYTPQSDDEVLCAIGNPRQRRSVVQRLSTRGAQFHTFVDDRAVLGIGATLGHGAVICPGVVISSNVTLGNHVHVNFNCSIGHDVTLGPYVTLSPSVNIMGQVVVGTGTFFGGSAVVLPRILIGDRVVVGAGSVAIHGLDDGVTVVGNPGRIVNESRKTKV